MTTVEVVVLGDQEQEGRDQEVGLAENQQAPDRDRHPAERADVALLLHELLQGQDDEEGRHHEVQPLDLDVEGRTEEAAEKGPQHPVAVVQHGDPELDRGLVTVVRHPQAVVDHEGLVGQAKQQQEPAPAVVRVLGQHRDPVEELAEADHGGDQQDVDRVEVLGQEGGDDELDRTPIDRRRHQGRVPE